MSGTVTIIQARTGSVRLPGKVLMPLAGKPMILRMLERLAAASHCGRIVCATSAKPADDAVAITCEEKDIEIFRGSELDVLDRYYQAALEHDARIVVRCRGDCPLIDPDVVDLIIETFFKGEYDYVCNNMPRTYPDGMDVEVMNFEALERTWREAVKEDERESVTSYIRNHPDIFSIGKVSHYPPLGYHRWTVDEKADYDFVRKVYELLYYPGRIFRMDDILELERLNPGLSMINAHLSDERWPES